MRKFAIFSLLIMLMCTIPALAQDTLQMNVPFEFQVGTMVLPAGQYTMISPSDNTLLIRAADPAVKPVKVLIREVAANKLQKVSDVERRNEILFRRGDDGRFILHTVQMISMTHSHDVIHAEADMP